MSFLKSAGDFVSFLILMVIYIVEAIVKWFIPTKYKMKDVTGEIALVTGGGNGLGRLVSLRLAKLGVIVVIWDVNKVGAEETVKLVQAAGGTCYGYVCDLCDREDIYRKAALVKEEVGQVTILINNAGVVSGSKFLDTPDKLIIRTMDVNIMSHFWTTKAFLPSMMEKNHGHIVSIASLAGHIGVPKLVDYCTSKFAAVGFEEALHMELMSEGYNNINTTVICPFFIRSTGMFYDVAPKVFPTLSPNEVADRVVSAIRCNEKYAMVPSYLQLLILTKWALPWASVALFVRSIIPKTCNYSSSTTPLDKETVPSMLSKEQNSTNIHQQLTRRVSSSERKP